MASSSSRIRGSTRQRAGDGHALALAARQGHAPLADHGVVAVGQGGDELVGLGGARRRLDLVLGGVRPAEGDVLADGAPEQHGLLKHDTDVGPQALQAYIAHIGAVDAHRSGRDVVEAGDQVEHRRLAGPGRAQQGDGLPRFGHETDVVEHHGLLAHVAEADVVELHPALDAFQIAGAGPVLDLDLGVDDLERPGARSPPPATSPRR